nr:Chain P, ESAT-6-like protein EsxH [Mycobacterium tuberculosis H37Rv]7P4B_Q Chain Q, ESAT-6-like protein EsxH [Mycobacterium tuberculosis H37Rv]7P4B_R Chain R, ESAT-6-like protein EsxH [Mycobacterium tuberculosis H37Rv]7P4B_Z Chain Z, ESAT-6-like protein EsxH [Mycobacterium tuberculosis H37Rv]
IMYNYPAML